MGSVRLCVTLAVLAGFATAQYSGQGQGQGQGGGQQQQQTNPHAFIPQQHPACEYKHACIYWEYCVNGVINIYGVGQIDVRQHGTEPIPAGYPPQCPDTPFAVCCEIPDEIFTGPIWSSQCLEEHTTCVPKYQCLNGEINTSGFGLLDVRVYGKPSPNTYVPQNCTSSDPRYAAVPAECCRLPEPHPLIGCPGNTVCLQESDCITPIPTNANGFYDECYTNTATVETGVCCSPQAPDPVYICPTDQVCVDRNTCTAGGTINTYGEGLIDVRINVPCFLDDLTQEQGVCCNPPINEIRTQCPGAGTHVCVDSNICKGSSLIDAFGRPLFCDLGGGSTGVCCESPDPVDVCSNDGQFECVDENLCTGNNLLDVYGNVKTCNNPYGGGAGFGVCCENPVLTSCSSDTSYFCTPYGTCQDSVLSDSITSVPSRCYVGGTTEVGVCCPSPHVESCAAGDVCTYYGECAGITVVNNYGNELYCTLNSTSSGTCCTPLTCYGTDSCLTADRCDPVKTPDINSASDCYLPDFTLGKCCAAKPDPVKHIECAGDSVCLPDVLCQGEILANDGAYYDYAQSGYTWSQCKLSGTNLGINGVCCRNAQIVEPELPKAAQKCGVRNVGLDQRIQNNELINYQAQFAEFPWQAIIFFKNFTFKCGASLIGDGWLLTAAHCVDGYTKDDLRIRLGEWKVDSYDEIGQYLDVGIHSIYMHPEYVPKILHNDIALIRLAKSVIFKYHINAVCLPEVGQQFYDQTRCFATGWGKDAFDGGLYQVIMKKVDLPLVNKGECQRYLQKTRLGKFFKLHQSFLCAGGEEGKDACEGDGGGPLVCQDPSTGQYVQVGITAWGIGCGSKDVPGVFVDVEYFRTWINGILFSNEAQQVYGK